MRLARPELEVLLLSAAAGVTALVLGALKLERRSLWIDEALDVGWTELGWRDYLKVTFENEASQALYLVLLKPWLAVVANDEWSVRAPSVLFAAAAAALVVPLALRLTGSRLAAAGAGILLATNAFVVSWAQQARTYTLAMLLAIVVTYLFVQALQSEGWRWWIAYGVVGGIAVYSHFFVALVLVSHAAAVAVAPWASVRRFAAAGGIAFLLALPALNFVINHDTGQADWHPPVDWPYFEDVMYELGGESPFALALGALAVVVLLAAAARRPNDAWRHLLIASWLVVPLMITLAVSTWKPMLLDRFLIVSVPALAIATAYVLSRLGSWAGTASLAVVVAIALTHVDHWYKSLVEQDWRGAVAYVEARRQPGEQLVVHPHWLSPSVEFYAAEEPADSPLSAPRAWVVSLTERAPEVEQLAADSQYAIVESRNFVSVHVWRVKKP